MMLIVRHRARARLTDDVQPRAPAQGRGRLGSWHALSTEHRRKLRPSRASRRASTLPTSDAVLSPEIEYVRDQRLELPTFTQRH